MHQGKRRGALVRLRASGLGRPLASFNAFWIAAFDLTRCPPGCAHALKSSIAYAYFSTAQLRSVSRRSSRRFCKCGPHRTEGCALATLP